MTKKRFLFAAIFLMVLLASAELVFHFLYHEDSAARLEECFERRDRDKTTDDDCWSSKNAADAAYSSATANHILMIGFSLTIMLVLSSRLDSAEKRIDQLEQRGNV